MYSRQRHRTQVCNTHTQAGDTTLHIIANHEYCNQYSCIATISVSLYQISIFLLYSTLDTFQPALCTHWESQTIRLQIEWKLQIVAIVKQNPLYIACSIYRRIIRCKSNSSRLVLCARRIYWQDATATGRNQGSICQGRKLLGRGVDPKQIVNPPT